MLSDHKVSQLRSAYSLLEESVLILDHRCLVRGRNQTAADLLDGDDLSSGGNDLDVLVGKLDDRKRLLWDVRTVLEDGLPRERDTVSGSGRHLHHKLAPIKAENGSVEGVLLRSFDITEKVNERMSFAKVQEMTLTVWWEWDISEDVLKLFAPDKCILGFDPNAFIPSIGYWEEKVHPDDLENYNLSLQDCLEGRKDEWLVEHRYSDAKNEWRWIKTRGQISERNDLGEPMKMIGATINYDQQKRRQLQLVDQAKELSMLAERLELATAGTGIWDFDLKNDLLIWDESMYRLYEIDPDEFAGCYEAWASRVHPDDLERSDNDVKRCIEERTDFRSLFRICLPGNQIRWIEARGSLKFDEHGVPIRLVGSNLDVTELTLAREQMKTAKEEAEAASEAKSAFLAMMSHELRTPLNPIMGLTEILLLEEGISEEQASWIRTINARSQDLLRLIDDILDISRIESGRLAVESKPEKLSRLIEEVLEIYRGACEEKGILLVSEIDARFSQDIMFDPAKTRQVLLNLVGNAVKFTQTGQIVISAYYEEFPTEDNTTSVIRLGIRDTGAGIPVSEHDAVFDAFYQVDMSMTRKSEGAGLGLAICKRLIDVMGGRIWIDADYERGTMMHVVIPAMEAKHDSVESMIEESVSMTSIEHVLIAEDDASNAETLSLLLESLSIHSSIARTGQEAVNACDQEAFDLILMDVKMPVMDGLLATEILREKGFEMPIIGATAFAFDSDEEACLSAGMDAWLPKPIGFRDLKSTLAKFGGARS